MPDPSKRRPVAVVALAVAGALSVIVAALRRVRRK
jgi:hypothetical protein